MRVVSIAACHHRWFHGFHEFVFINRPNLAGEIQILSDFVVILKRSRSGHWRKMSRLAGGFCARHRKMCLGLNRPINAIPELLDRPSEFLHRLYFAALDDSLEF